MTFSPPTGEPNDRPLHPETAWRRWSTPQEDNTVAPWRKTWRWEVCEWPLGRLSWVQRYGYWGEA